MSAGRCESVGFRGEEGEFGEILLSRGDVVSLTTGGVIMAEFVNAWKADLKLKGFAPTTSKEYLLRRYETSSRYYRRSPEDSVRRMSGKFLLTSCG